MRGLGFGYYGFGLGGALDNLKTVADLRGYLDMRWNEASQVGASEAMSIYDSVRSTFSSYSGSTSLIPLAEWGNAYGKLKDAYTKIEAKRAAGRKEAEEHEAKVAAGTKYVIDTGIKLYEISKTPGQQTPVRETIITPGRGGPAPEAQPLPRWVLPIAIGGGALFFMMMMVMMIKRNPKIL